MKRVLLAGATGYLGSYIAEALQKRGYRVRAIARHPETLKQKNVATDEVLRAELKKSGLGYGVIRPNGFFSDLSSFYHMAQKGRVYLFGNGDVKSNPIDGEDLAEVCVDAIEMSDKEIDVGGPETLTQNEMAMMAFQVSGKTPKITHLPDWLGRVLLKTVNGFTGSRISGPMEFFLTVMAMDMLAPEYGNHRLEDYFIHLSSG